MLNIKKTILLVAPGEKEVIELEGNIVAIERFIEEILRPKSDKSEATKPSLPKYNTEIYIFPDKARMVMAKNLWEQEFSLWPGKQ